MSVFIGGVKVNEMFINGVKVSKAWINGELITAPSTNLNLLSNDPSYWEQGDWAGGAASPGTPLTPTIAGAAQWRFRIREPISVPAGSLLRFATNFHGIFIVRVLTHNNIVSRDLGQLHGAQDGVEVQLNANEVGIALSLSNLPQTENSAGGSNAVWLNRLATGEVVPELEVIW